VVANDGLTKMDARLDRQQRQAVGTLAVFGFLPQWFYTERLKLRALPSDEMERQALLDGLDALAGTVSGRQKP
jgi:hypothetical protein